MGKFKTFTVEESVHLICNIVNKSVVYKGGDLCYKFWNGLSINILFILVFCIRGEIVHTRPYVVLCGIRWVKAGTIILCFTTTLRESTKILHPYVVRYAVGKIRNDSSFLFYYGALGIYKLYTPYVVRYIWWVKAGTMAVLFK